MTPPCAATNCISQSSQYGSIIFPLDEEQKAIAKAVLNEMRASDRYDCAIDTIIQPSYEFYPAEEYHQDYYKKHNLQDVEDFTC
jgi:peptide methionine sulfoxide reductase MsrA